MECASVGQAPTWAVFCGATMLNKKNHSRQGLAMRASTVFAVRRAMEYMWCVHMPTRAARVDCLLLCVHHPRIVEGNDIC